MVAGRYVLQRLIASGGMAQVWKADDSVLGRAVAAKLLHPHLAGDPEFVDRFRAEARAAARLSHQSIVAIYDTASEDGVEAIVMELISGMTLRQYLDGYGTLSLPDAVDLVTQVAGALDVAHAARLVHRDIKPGNIMLCPDRRVKVTDFGIAKALEDGDRTSQGTLLGTAKYLAPEQVEGVAIDPRADIYSLGVVLYEAITGSAPFDAETDSATALARLHTDPRPPSALVPWLSPAIEAVMLQALARDRDDRPASAGAFARAFAAAVAAAPAPDDGIDNGHRATTLAFDPTGLAHATGHRADIDLTTIDAGEVMDPTRRRPRAADTAPAGAVSPPDRIGVMRVVRTGLLVFVIAASLALGVGLIVATAAGRGFFERARDNLAGEDTAPDGSDATPVGATDQPRTDGAGNPSDEPTDERDDGPGDGPEGLAVAEINDFDPLGDGEERPQHLQRAIDGKPKTMWSSEQYENRALGNLKPGVGIVLVLDGPETLDTLDVISPTRGWEAQVYLAEAPAGELGAWGEPIDARTDIDGDTSFDLRGVKAGAVLLWITDLGDAPPRLRMEIAELTLT